jgi:hypothetical protein
MTERDDDTAEPAPALLPATAVDTIGLALIRPFRPADETDAVGRIQAALRAAIDR